MRVQWEVSFCDYIFIEKVKASRELGMEQKTVDDQQEWLKRNNFSDKVH